ncbi:YbaN family protein [Atopomonas sediminilitoris]|uniref:YbaN family protein n=1 Tax=Atopomonas sediminilitoris TaxID=2919919 RepID=UPI001F4E1559|nr:YbaN family protein [Atopomonas sediminilitoris]MCJ8168813.1 YbaN family protein [Atopomonas sediminilitoris]
MPPHSPREFQQPWLRGVLFACGWLCVVLGVIGIALPGLPTTPFLLLAAACFVRSSERVYRWLVQHPQLGPWVRDYLDGSGMPRKAKIYALTLIWGCIALSALLVPRPSLWLFMLLGGLCGSYFVLKQKTRDR